MKSHTEKNDVMTQTIKVFTLISNNIITQISLPRKVWGRLRNIHMEPLLCCMGCKQGFIHDTGMGVDQYFLEVKTYVLIKLYSRPR